MGCTTRYAARRTLAHWLRLNGESLPPSPVDDMVIHPRERDLVVGTHGRSIWVLDDVSMFSQLDAATRARPLALLHPMPARPRLYAGEDYGIGNGVFRAKNPPMGAYINFWVRDATGDAVSVSIADSTGFVLRELDAVPRMGINRVVWDLLRRRLRCAWQEIYRRSGCNEGETAWPLSNC